MNIKEEYNYKGFRPSVIHEIFYFMKYHQERNETIFKEYETEDRLLFCAKNAAVIIRDVTTGCLVGVSWIYPVEFINKDVEDYYMFSFFIAPEYRRGAVGAQGAAKKPHKLLTNTKVTLKDYILKNNLNHIKGLLIIGINKNVTRRIIERHDVDLVYLGEDSKRRRIAYYHFDGSRISHADFLKWLESKN